VFVLAPGAIWASAGAKLDLAAVEWPLEIGPLILRDRPIFVGRALGPPTVQEVLVVAYYVLVEDGYVASGCLHIEVAEQRGADVNGWLRRAGRAGWFRGWCCVARTAPDRWAAVAGEAFVGGQAWDQAR
jgi:hypothetical protein